MGMRKTKERGEGEGGQASGWRKLVKYKELPEYLKDNEYILDYYRSEWPLKDSCLSLFSWHNETLNVWTHLGGFFIFAALTAMSLMEKTGIGGLLLPLLTRSRGPLPAAALMAVIRDMEMNVSSTTYMFNDSNWRRIHHPSILQTTQSSHDNIPGWPWYVFLAGAMTCLICSSLSHLLASHSKPFHLFFWRLDYAGISVMIVSSFFAPIYYAFFCHPYSRLLYLSFISILGVLVVFTLLSPALSAPHYRTLRARLFLSMGLSGVVPAVHAVVVNWHSPTIFVALGYELLMGLLYAIGAWFYVSRVPEKWRPGAFDIAGHSHQIFHVFVVGGALAHCAATLTILDHRVRSPVCAPY